MEEGNFIIYLFIYIVVKIKHKNYISFNKK